MFEAREGRDVREDRYGRDRGDSRDEYYGRGKGDGHRYEEEEDRDRGGYYHKESHSYKDREEPIANEQVENVEFEHKKKRKTSDDFVAPPPPPPPPAPIQRAAPVDSRQSQQRQKLLEAGVASQRAVSIAMEKFAQVLKLEREVESTEIQIELVDERIKELHVLLDHLESKEIEQKY